MSTTALLVLFGAGVVAVLHDARRIDNQASASARTSKVYWPVTGTEVEDADFSELHEPYDQGLPRSVMSDIWDAIDRLDSPTARGGEEPPWQLVGPLRTA